MSDAPETIWASTGLYYDYVTDWSEGEWLARGPHGVEYRRADLPATDAQAIANPKMQALVEASRYLIPIIDALVKESGRFVDYDAEDAFRMGEWFEDHELQAVDTARAALAALEVK